MSLFAVHFEELYRRHLCRHSQLGLNVLHLLAVAGIYFGLCELISSALVAAGVVHPLPVLGVILVPYLALLGFNVPARVWLATALTMALVVAAVAVVPPVPWWASLLTIVGLHQFQQWSHRLYPLERDMSRFREKYVKGPRLFVILAVYELPILLYYLLFGRSDWVRGRRFGAACRDSGELANASHVSPTEGCASPMTSANAALHDIPA